MTDLTATLNGTVNPGGDSFFSYFDWGLTSTYGNTSSSSYSSGTATVAISKNITGLLPNTTYHFRIRNSAGTYFGSDMTFTTATASTPPSFSSTSSNSVGITSASLSADFNTGSSAANLSFQFGPTTAYGSEIAYPPTFSIQLNAYGSVNLTNLIAGTTYHYRAKAVNEQGTVYSTDKTFTTLNAPVLTTSSATSITDLSATLNGTVNPGGGSFYTYFDWGLTSTYGNTSVGAYASGPAPVPSSANISGLLPATTYHFRITNSNDTYYGADMTFTTAAPVTPPTITSSSSSSVAPTSVSLTAYATTGSSPTTLSFEYGTTTAYGSEAIYSTTLPTNSSSSGTVNLTNLAPGTTYHYRAKAVNGQGTAYSTDKTFTTLNFPVFITSAATAVTDITATLNGTLNGGGGSLSAYFEWGTTSDYGSLVSTTATSGTTTVAAAANITGLQPSTTYHFRITNFARTYYGGDMTFTTGAPVTRPAISNNSSSSVTITTASLSATVNAGSSPTTLTFEYGTTTAYGSESVYPATLATSSSSNRTVNLSNLTPGTTYHWRSKAVNSTGTVYSGDNTFTTLNVPVLTTAAATAVTDLSATLNGTINPGGGSIYFLFEWGVTPSYGTSNYENSASGTTTLAKSANITGLLPNTTYHFRIKNSTSTYFGSDMTFTTAAPATPPTISSTSAPSVQLSSASLNAYGSSGSSPATLSIEYGTTTAYGSESFYQTPLATSSSFSLSMTLANLTPGTTYHYRTKVANAQGTVYSADQTFKTLDTPVLTTVGATAVTDLTATLNSTVNAGGGSLNIRFEWGTTLAYGNSLSADYVTGTNTNSRYANLTGLIPNTTYHFRIATSDGNYYGADMAFTTGAPATLPSISSTSSSSISPTTASLAASVATGSSPTTLSFEYGTTTAYGFESTYAQTLATSSNASGTVALANLLPDTIYHFRSKAVNTEGTTYSTDKIFTTLKLPVVNTTAATALTDVSVAFNGTVNAGGGVISIYFDWGNTEAYGNTTSSLSNASGTTTLTRTHSPTGLQPGTTYHYRLRGVDTFNNVYLGSDVTFTTGVPSTLPSLGTVTASSVSSAKATISVSLASSGGSPATVAIEYGLTTSYGLSRPVGSLWTNSSSFLSGTLDQLTTGTTYHCRYVISNAQGTVTSPDLVFTTKNITAITQPASSITDISATLNGLVTYSGSSATVSFNWGTTTNYGSTAYPTDGSSASNLVNSPKSAVITGLTAGTTYHYRIEISDPTGFYGADQTFTTPPAQSAPTLGTVSIPKITSTKAEIYTNIVYSANSLATVNCEYGVTASYGNTAMISALAANKTPSVRGLLTGLTPSTLYHYRVKISNNQGTAYSPDATFTTKNLPTLTTTSPTAVGDTSATLTGVAQPEGNSLSYSFDFGPTSSYGSSYYGSSSSSSASTETVTSSISQLQPDTSYRYRLKATDYFGAVFYGQDQAFQTTAPVYLPDTPTVAASTRTDSFIELSISGIFTKELPCSMVVDYGLTSAYGSQISYGSTIRARVSYGTASVVIPNLQPLTTYHYRVSLVTTAGTVSTPDGTAITASAPTVVTNTAANITDRTATLSGIVTFGPDLTGTSLGYDFEYGPTDSYGSISTGGYINSLTSNSPAPSVAFKVSPGTTYHYRLRVRVNFTCYYGNDVVFTSAPASTPPSILSASVSKSTATSVQASASLYTGSAPAQIIVEYGTTLAYGAELSYQNLTGNSTFEYLTFALTGLQPNTLYHYRFKAVNAEGTVVGADNLCATTLATNVQTGEAFAIGDASATVSGAYYDLSGTAVAKFEYGLTTAYGATSAPISTVTFGSQITGLLPDTLYHYRMIVQNADGTFYGADRTFTTLPRPVAVIVSTSISSFLSGAVAKPSATVRAGNSPATVFFQYGPTTSYGTQITSPIPVPSYTEAARTAFFTSLPSNTTYHYRVGVNDGTGTIYSPDYEFSTPRILGSPKVQTADAINITETDAVLLGYGNSAGSSALSFRFDYGPTTNYGSETNSFFPAPSSFNDFPVSMSLTSLRAGTTYHFRLKGINGTEILYGEDRTFTTLGAPPIPNSGAPILATGNASSILPTSAYLRAGVVQSGALPINVSLEYGLTTAYGTRVFLKSQDAQTFSDFGQTITGLTHATTYHFRTVVEDGQSTYYGEDSTFKTQSPIFEITTLPAMTVRASSAILLGSYNVNHPDGSLYFEYGLDQSYGTSVIMDPSDLSTGSPAKKLMAPLSGLLPSTTYHYRLALQSALGNAFGNDLTFTTLSSTLPSLETTPHFVTRKQSPGSSSVQYDITFNGSVNPHGNAVSAFFEFGYTTKYGATAPANPGTLTGNIDVPVSFTLSNYNSTFHYRIGLYSPLGIIYGSDMTATLLEPFTVTTGTFQTSSPTSATLTASVTSPYDSYYPQQSPNLVYFEFGTTTGYGTIIGPHGSQLPFWRGFVGNGTNVPILPETTYHYRAVAIGNNGIYYGSDVAFTTRSLTPNPSLTNQPATDVTATTATLHGQDTTYGDIDEMFFTYGGNGILNQSVIGSPYLTSANGTSSTSAQLTGLLPDTTYSFRLNSRAGGASPPLTFTTLTTLEAWRALHFQNTANVGPGADLATPDSDGIPNLVKYALLLPTGTPAADELPTPELKTYLDGTRLAVTFKRSPERKEAAISVEVAYTPAGPWTAVGTVTNGATCVGPGLVSETPLSASEIQVEVRDTTSTSATGKRFMRLRVSR